MKTVVLDTEANRLKKPNKLHCAVFRDVAAPENPHVFENAHLNPRPLRDFLSGVGILIGHNILGFDLLALRSACGIVFPSDRCIDTLVVSRFLNPALGGGHSLEEWGERFGVKKEGTGIRDWEEYTPVMLQRCLSDSDINLRLYRHLLPYIQRPEYAQALRLEHDFIEYTNGLTETGFEFDKEKAEALKDTLLKRLNEIDSSLVSSFPSNIIVKKEFTPKTTKAGTLGLKDFNWVPKDTLGNRDISFFKPDVEYSLVSIEPFNPGSLHQIIDRLWDAGWKPTEKTKGHIEFLKARTKDPEKKDHYNRYGWKVSNENLLTLPDTAPPAAKRLVERILLASRISDLEEWLAVCTPVPDDPRRYRIHGSFNSIGAWTQRVAHSKPNMANIPVHQYKDKEEDYTELDRLSNYINDEMRSYWVSRPGYKLVGTDADGIQMRIFAHYTNEKRLIESLVNGNKKLGTDIHSLNRQALGDVCKGRDYAKTFIYAWLLGAGLAKVAEILGCSLEEARRAVTDFLGFYPGLQHLKETIIPQDAQRGYFIGLDKRPVICDNTHTMLAGYLQNGEVLVMKYASRIWNQRLKKEKIPYYWVNFVHDEWQTEVLDEDNLPEYVGQCQIEAIIQAGELLNLNCPLMGQAKYGYNWKETH